MIKAIMQTFLVAVFLSSSVNAFAVEEISKQEIKDLQAKMSARKDLAVDFEQLRTSALRPQKPSVSKGHANFQKPSKFRWETQSPKADVIVFDGKDLVNFKPGDSTATRYKTDGDRVKEIREVIDFVMDFDSLLKRYKISNSTRNGPDLNLSLTPANKNNAVNLLELIIDQEKGLVKSLKMVFQNKNVTEFRFSNANFSAGSAPIFAVPAGIKIVDGL